MVIGDVDFMILRVSVLIFAVDCGVCCVASYVGGLPYSRRFFSSVRISREQLAAVVEALPHEYRGYVLISQGWLVVVEALPQLRSRISQRRLVAGF